MKVCSLKILLQLWTKLLLGKEETHIKKQLTQLTSLGHLAIIVIMSEQMIWARKALIEIHTLSLRAC